MRFRSSGQKSTVFTVSQSSDAVFFTLFTLIFFAVPGRRTMFTVCSRSWLSTSASISAEEKPKPTSSLSNRVRKLRPVESIYTLSKRFVLPCAFAPLITFVPGANSAVSHS